MAPRRYNADSRGVADYGWLQSRFSFSFANYHDPSRMGFKALRVLNDDVVGPGAGFPLHPHDNMEIITVVTEGELEHKDTHGGGGICRPGDVQVMSAGSGLSHSEMNRSKTDALKLFQIWIETKVRNSVPRYEQRQFFFPDNTLVAVASGLGDVGALALQQDARMLLGTFGAGAEFALTVAPGRGVFAFVVEGTFEIMGETLHARDALEISDVSEVRGEARSPAQILLVETV